MGAMAVENGVRSRRMSSLFSPSCWDFPLFESIGKQKAMFFSDIVHRGQASGHREKNKSWWECAH